MALTFISILLRFIIMLVFSISFSGKVRDIASFQHTIKDFKILPVELAWPAAFIFLGGELIVVIAMIIGGGASTWGYLLGITLLTSFSIALVAVLLRNIETPCNCFGVEQEVVSKYDVLRNLCFIFCCLAGYGLSKTRQAPMGIAAYVLAVVVAIVFTTIWIKLKLVASSLQ